MEDNKVLASAIKIIGSEGGLKAGEILRESKSLNFISVKSVNKDDAPKLVRDIESLVVKLDDAVAGLYREGAGPDLNAQYEDLLEQLRHQQKRLKYLSSYFETTAEKIQAVKKSIEEHEKKIEESEARKKRIEESMKKLRANVKQRSTKSNKSKTTQNPFRLPDLYAQRPRAPISAHKNPREIELLLEPPRPQSESASTFANPADDIDMDELDWSDFHEKDEIDFWSVE